MLWKKGRRSDNVVDARNDSGGGGGGMRFGGGKGLSLTAIVLIVGIGWLTGQDPMQILGQLTGQMEQAPSVSTQPRQAPPANDEQADFVRAVLGDTEDTWGQVFQENGLAYKNPKLILFRGRVTQPVVAPPRPAARSTARLTSRCTWTWISSGKCRNASRPPVISPRPT